MYDPRNTQCLATLGILTEKRPTLVYVYGEWSRA